MDMTRILNNIILKMIQIKYLKNMITNNNFKINLF